jgi:2Fe-2S ferredoxin
MAQKSVKTHKLTFVAGAIAPIVVDARDGDSILDSALNSDVPLQHACGGFCACTTCHVQVKDGGERLSTIEGEEEERLASLEGYTPVSRLGCQARVHGDVTVEIVNVDAGM